MLEPVRPQEDIQFEVIFFDLGNTLIYFDGNWERVRHESALAAVRYFETLGYHEMDWGKFGDTLVRRIQRYYVERENEYFEYPTERLMESILSEFECEAIFVDHIRPALSAMYSISQAFWHPEEDAAPTLEKLIARGHRLGIISNAAYSLDVQQLIEKADLHSYFEEIIISADIGLRKPHPRIFEVALERMMVDPTRAVMIGDTLSADIQGAKNSKMANIWITRRADPVKNRFFLDTIRPDRIILGLSELPELLGNW
jgi:HAD superfamily hydrolase (TIGR01549 family)